MSDVPLLNHYKLPFVKRRLQQTLLGGLRLCFPHKVPHYIYVIQIFLFFLPLILGLPFGLLVTFDVLSWEIGCYISGSLFCAAILIVNVTAAVVRAKRTTVGPQQSSGVDLEEEDDFEFSGCCHPSTVEFVVASKVFKINYVIHPLLAGFVLAGCVWFLEMKRLEELFGMLPAAGVVAAFSWVSVCVGLYSLSIMRPEEVAIYRNPDVFDELALSRSFHMAVCIAVHIAAQYLPGLTVANQIVHGIFAAFPLLWGLGLLPHIEPIFLWLCEQLLIHGFGGSAMASGLRIVLMLAASATVLVAIVFINSVMTRVVLCSLFGYLLAIDLGGLCARLSELCCTSKLQRERTIRMSGFLWRWHTFEVLFHCLMGTVSVGLSCGMHALLTDATLKVNIADYFGKATLGLFALELMLCDLQRVYFLGGLVRNPLFPTCVHLPEEFQRKKRCIRGLGYVRRVCINCVSPAVLLGYLTSSVSLKDSWIALLAEWRAYRSVWQSTELSLFDASIQVIIRLALPASSPWLSLGVGLNLLIIGVARARAAELGGKLYAYAILLIKSYADRKQRRAHSLRLLVLNCLLIPLLLGVLAVAAALSAPFLPLFTLPVLLVGFPRPCKFWPTAVGASESKCDDTAIYRQLTPALVRSLREAFSNGTLSWSRNGSYFLIRFHDRLVWITVLESGYAFCCINVKGLELQTTSCHVQEVARIDDLADTIGMEQTSRAVSCINPSPAHTWRVKDTLQFITYSDASNQLTGIIDTEDFMKGFSSALVKSLTWLLLRQLSSSPLDDAANKQPITANQQPAHDEMPPHTTVAISAWVSPSRSSQQEAMSLGSLGSVRSRSSAKEHRISDWSDSESDDFVDGASVRDAALGRGNLLTEVTSHRNGELSLPPVEVLSSSRKLPPLRVTRPLAGDIGVDLGIGAFDGLELTPTSPRLASRSIGDSRQRIPTNFKFNGGYLAFPKDWGDLPLHYASNPNSFFQRDWFLFCLRNLPKVTELGYNDLSADSRLLESISKLTGLLADIHLGNDALSVRHIFNVYCNKIKWQAHLDWLERRPDLRALALVAWRYATKICLDQVIIGELETNDDFEELLLEYEREWYIGSESEAAWQDGINTQKPNLFSLSYDNMMTIYRSRTLSLQQCIAPVGSLSRELVRAMWSNLNLELLFMTNDDEERYSIQAQPTTLRNLTVQAADPPLGYPIFSSPPISVPRI